MVKDKFDQIFENLKNESDKDKKRQEDQVKKLTDELEIQQKKKKNILIPIQHELAEDILKIKTKISQISKFIQVYASFF